MICVLRFLVDLYIRFPQLPDVPGCVFFRTPGARDLLLVHVGCDPTVLVSSIDVNQKAMTILCSIHVRQNTLVLVYVP